MVHSGIIVVIKAFERDLIWLLLEVESFAFGLFGLGVSVILLSLSPIYRGRLSILFLAFFVFFFLAVVG